MKRILHTGLKALLVSLAIAVSGATAHTTFASVSGLTVSPTALDVEIAPGETYSGKMKVLNQSELDTNYTAYVTPYSVSGEEYKPYFSPVKGAVDITKWFSLGKTQNALKVGDTNDIPFTITVPKGTGAGSYFATIFAETKDKGSQGVVTRKRVGMVVYLRVSGKAIEKGSVEQWSVPLLQQAPFTATAKIANNGSVHFPATINVTVSDLFGHKKFTYERKPEILPQKLRSVPIVWEKGATLGFFKVDGQVAYLGKTEKLPTKYVFIANTSMRLFIIAMLLCIVVGLSVVFAGRKKHAPSPPKE